MEVREVGGREEGRRWGKEGEEGGRERRGVEMSEWRGWESRNMEPREEGGMEGERRLKKGGREEGRRWGEEGEEH